MFKSDYLWWRKTLSLFLEVYLSHPATMHVARWKGETKVYLLINFLCYYVFTEQMISKTTSIICFLQSCQFEKKWTHPMVPLWCILQRRIISELLPWIFVDLSTAPPADERAKVVIIGVLPNTLYRFFVYNGFSWSMLNLCEDSRIFSQVLSISMTKIQCTDPILVLAGQLMCKTLAPMNTTMLYHCYCYY